jgi:RNA polymerase sigma-70 factor (ECF subfamily)
MLAIALAEPLYRIISEGALDSAERQEREIVQRAQRLDQRALAWLYECYYPRVYSYILLQLGDAQQAEDIASETMLKMLEALPRYKFRGVPFSAWVFRIARNCLIDHRRRRGRRVEVRLDTVAEAQAQDPSPAARAEMSESYEKLRRALAQLTDEQRQVVILKFVQGLDNRTIAKVLGRREGAIKSLQYRALQALKRILQQEGEG